MKRSPHAFALLLVGRRARCACQTRTPRAAQPFVPGTGEFLGDCCDNFEDPNWSYRYNHPKSSHEQDEKQRGPGGRSSNGLWHEGGKRGTPDLVKRVETPLGRHPRQHRRADVRHAQLRHSRPHRQLAAAGRPADAVRPAAGPLDSDLLAAELHGSRVLAAVRGMGKSHRPAVRHAVPIARAATRTARVEAYWPGMFLLFHSETNRNIEDRTPPRFPSAATGWATTFARSTSPSQVGGRSACRSRPTGRFTTTPAKASTT